MPLRPSGSGILAEALELLQEADRINRRFFTVSLGREAPAWQPPIDIVERGRTLVVQVALPGVALDSLDVRTDGARLHVAGARRQAAGPGDIIHRLEIPYGRFERRIELPPGRYELMASNLCDGCLALQLRRLD